MDNSVYVYAGDELTRIFAIAMSLSVLIGGVTKWAGGAFPSTLHGERLGAFALVLGPALALAGKGIGVESVALDWFATGVMGLAASFISMGGHHFLKNIEASKAAKVAAPAAKKKPRKAA